MSVCLAEPTGMEWLCVYTDISLYSLQAIVGGKTTLGEGGEQRVGWGGGGLRGGDGGGVRNGREGGGGGRRRSNQYLIVTECPRLVIFMASPGIIDGVWVNRRWGERPGKGREREGGRWGAEVGKGGHRERLAGKRGIIAAVSIVGSTSMSDGLWRVVAAVVIEKRPSPAVGCETDVPAVRNKARTIRTALHFFFFFSPARFVCVFALSAALFALFFSFCCCVFILRARHNRGASH